MRDRGTGRIFKPKNCNIYYIQYWSDGKQIRESSKQGGRTGFVKAEAQTLLNDRLGAKDKGATPLQTQRKIRYADLRQLLLDSYRAKKNRSLQVLSDGTETIWGLKPVDDFFGYKPPEKLGEPPKNPGVPALEITNSAFRKFMRERRAEGVSDGTIRGSWALVRRMWTLAENERLIDRHLIPKFEFPSPPDGRDDFIRVGQLGKLLTALPEHLRPFVFFLFFQGVRSGEAKSICWHQIDLDNALYQPMNNENKTSDETKKNISSNVLEVLRAMNQGRATSSRNDLVFDSTNLRKAFITACLKAKIVDESNGEASRYTWVCGQCRATNDTVSKKGPAPQCERCNCPMCWQYCGFTIHGFRRSCVVFFAESGMRNVEIRAITGHKSIETFEKHYNKTSVSAVRAGQDRAVSSIPANLLPALSEQKLLPAAR